MKPAQRRKINPHRLEVSATVEDIRYLIDSLRQIVEALESLSGKKMPKGYEYSLNVEFQAKAKTGWVPLTKYSYEEARKDSFDLLELSVGTFNCALEMRKHGILRPRDLEKYTFADLQKKKISGFNRKVYNELCEQATAIGLVLPTIKSRRKG